MPGTPIDVRRTSLSEMPIRHELVAVAASPSIDYEPHTFHCVDCRFRYTARIETPAAIRAFRLEQGGPTTRASRHFCR